jgi:cytoskeletal protein CcmA (bactofilin family)
MALFNKKKDLQQKDARASQGAISSILSKDMQVTGEVQFKGKTRIDGLIDGNVKGEYLVLSETGKIIGDVEVESLVCHGIIEGNINCKLVTAHSTAAIHGILVAANLTVESGASLNGEIKAIQNQNKKTNPISSPPSTKEKKEADKAP